MKIRIPTTAALAALAVCVVAASSLAEPVPLRMVLTNNAPFLTAAAVPEPGALFVFQTPALPVVADDTATFFKTNTPSELWLPAQLTEAAATQNFFFAFHWPGRSVAEFGSPETVLNQPPPDMVLITSGLPDSLLAGPAYTVDFFVTDPAGHVLPVSGAVQILAVRRADGAIHPDAHVLPAAQQLIGGHLRAQITLQSTTSLEGYTLGLGPVSYGESSASVLPAAINLGPDPLPSPTADALLQLLADVRSSAVDPVSSWGWPVSPGASYSVGGTYGEWRGKCNL